MNLKFQIISGLREKNENEEETMKIYLEYNIDSLRGVQNKEFQL